MPLFIRVGHEISLTFLEPTAVVLMLRLHPSRAATARKPERLETTPRMPLAEYIDLYGNCCGRLFAPAGRVVFRNDAIVADLRIYVWILTKHVHLLLTLVKLA
jgi:hypothetical protein